jgi:hypothetical protein
LHAIGGLSILLRATFCATTVELQAGFDARRSRRRSSKGACALVSLLPSMLAETSRGRWRRPVRVSPRVRAVLVGGAPTPAGARLACARPRTCR